MSEQIIEWFKDRKQVGPAVAQDVGQAATNESVIGSTPGHAVYMPKYLWGKGTLRMVASVTSVWMCL